MLENISSDKCETFIERHFDPNINAPPGHYLKPAITIAREEGAGGLTVASSLAEYLQKNTASHGEWTVFSHHLVAKVIEEHKLHKGMGDFMKEDHKGTLRDAFEEFIGLHPSTWTLVEKTNATILRLAQIGNVILVGRGANIVTSELQTAFHVHIVGSLENRIERAQKVFNLDEKPAYEYIKKKDEARKRYIKDNFSKNLNDPLLYHLVINTDLINYDEAAQIIGNAVIKRFKLDVPYKAPKSMAI
ncbi:MAG TPA: cytidylate kinase-like family protein [Syntrophorhabdaceae bacterium]|nr:cytidylate kinase-like family protein [Syntrophorhabdaceae bacterium]HOG40208.1 cytidylate kinase-like family protein [Syntrophorhabdaceae bacterium]